MKTAVACKHKSVKFIMHVVFALPPSVSLLGGCTLDRTSRKCLSCSVHYARIKRQCCSRSHVQPSSVNPIDSPRNATVCQQGSGLQSSDSFALKQLAKPLDKWLTEEECRFSCFPNIYFKGLVCKFWLDL